MTVEWPDSSEGRGERRGDLYVCKQWRDSGKGEKTGEGEKREFLFLFAGILGPKQRQNRALKLEVELGCLDLDFVFLCFCVFFFFFWF